MLFILLLFHYGQANERLQIRERRSVNCGQQVMLTHMQGAKLHSPMYPNYFDDQNQCMWEIRSFDPQSRIKVYFDDWVMPISTSGGCDTAYLELREIEQGNVKSNVKLCGRNPTFYVSNNDQLQISLQAMDSRGTNSVGPKRFALRVELTRDPSRVLATDGSYVVNGVSPLPPPPNLHPAQPPVQQYPQQYPPQQQPYDMGAYPQQQPHPQQQPYPQTPPQNSQYPDQYPQPMGPEVQSPDLLQHAIIKSSNNFGESNWPPRSGTPGPAGYQPNNLNGMYFPNSGATGYQQNPYDRYPTYEDLENEYDTTSGDEDEMDPKTKVAIVLFLIALFVGIVMCMAHAAKKRYNKRKDTTKETPSGESTSESTTKQKVRHIQIKIKENAAEIGEKVRVKSVKANDIIREKVSQIKEKVNNNNNSANQPEV